LVQLEDRTLLSGLDTVFHNLQTTLNDHLWMPNSGIQYTLPFLGKQLATTTDATFFTTIENAVTPVLPTDTSTLATAIGKAVKQTVMVTGPNGNGDYEIQFSGATVPLTGLTFDPGLPGLISTTNALSGMLQSVVSSHTIKVDVTLTYTLQLFYTVSNGNVMLDPTQNNSNTPLLSLSFSPTLEAFTASGNIGPVTLNVTDGSNPKSAFQAALQFGVQSTMPLDPKSIDDTNTTVAFQNAKADIILQLTVGASVPDLPQLSTTVDVGWDFSGTSNPLDLANQGNGPVPTVSFAVGVDLSTVINLVNPIIENIQQKLGFLKGVVDSIHSALATNIPILNVNLEDIIKQFDPSAGSNLDQLMTFANILDAILNWNVNDHQPGNSNSVPLATVGPFPADLRVSDLGTALNAFGDPYLQNPVNTQDVTNLVSTLTDALTGGNANSGASLQLPLLTDPVADLKALMGENVVLLQYKLPDLPFDLNANPPNPVASIQLGPFVIFPPLAATLSFDFGLVGGLTVGYDSYGFTSDWNAANNPHDRTNSPAYQQTFGHDPASSILEGVFLEDAHLQLQGGIGLQAMAALPLITVGGGGTLELSFGVKGLDFDTGDQSDLNPSWPNLATNEQPYHEPFLGGSREKVLQLGDIVWDVNNGGPLCPFVLGGDISLSFNAFVTVGVSPFSLTFNVNLGSITIASFNINTCSGGTGKVDIAEPLPYYVNGTDMLNNNLQTDAAKHNMISVPNLPGVAGDFQTKDNQYFGGKQFAGTQTVLLLDLGAYRKFNNQEASANGEELEVAPLSDDQGNATGLQVTETDQTGQPVTEDFLGLNAGTTTIVAIGEQDALNDPKGSSIPISVKVDRGVHANAYLTGGFGMNTFDYEGDGDTYMKGGPAFVETGEQHVRQIPQNKLIGGGGDNYLEGGEFQLAPDANLAWWNSLSGGRGPTSHNVLQASFAGATLTLGPNDGDQAFGGNGAFSTYILVAGKGSDTLTGGAGQDNEFDWNEKDGSVVVTGGPDSNFSPMDLGTPASNNFNIAANTPDETWDIHQDDTGEIVILVPNSSKTITARHIQVLSLDDVPRTNDPNTGQLIYSSGSAIKYQVDDLSLTGIDLINLNFHEQDNADPYSDQVLINAPSAPDQVDMSAFPQNGHGPLTAVEISFPTLPGPGSGGGSGGGTGGGPGGTGSGGGISADPKYFVVLAIPKPDEDSLTVNTQQFDDKVNILSTQSNIDGRTRGGNVFVNTNAGKNTINVGAGTPGDGIGLLDQMQGNLYIDAGPGTQNQLNVDEGFAVNGDTLALTADPEVQSNGNTLTAVYLYQLRRYLPKLLPIPEGGGEGAFTPGGNIFGLPQPAATVRYPMLIQYAVDSGGAYGAGVNLYETRAPDTLYVTDTMAGAPTTIYTDGNQLSTNPKDKIVVGYNPLDTYGRPKVAADSVLNGVAGALDVEGTNGITGSGDVDLQIFDESAGSAQYQVNAQDVQRSGLLPITYNELGLPGFEGSLALNAGNSSNSISVTSTAKDTDTTANTGDGNNTILVGEPIFLFRPPPLPPILLGYNLNHIQGTLTINGGTAANNLTIDDDFDFAAYSYFLTANTLDRFGMATIAFNQMTTVDVFEANPQDNTTYVSGTAAGTHVTVHPGDGTCSLNAISLDLNQGLLDFIWTSGVKGLAVDDTAATGMDTYTLNPLNLERTGALPIRWNHDLAAVHLAVGASPAGTPPAELVYIPAINPSTQVAVFGEPGGTTIRVGTSGQGQGEDLTSIQGSLSVMGVVGRNTSLILDDRNAATGRVYTVGGIEFDASVNSSANPPPFCKIHYFDLSNLFLDSGTMGNRTQVTGVASGNSVVVLAESNDQVTVGDNHILQNIFGTLGVMGAPMSTVQLTLDDANGALNSGYLLKSNEVDHGPARVFYTNLSGLTLKGSGGGDIYAVASLPAATQDRIAAAGLGNSLDYSQYVGDVIVDLPLGMATGLNGGITNIQNVTGSQGNNLIVGDANANKLNGGTGRNIVIGGAGADTVNASKATSDNILISGTTDYDANMPDLQAIFGEWTRTDLGFHDRFDDLTSGKNSLKLTPLNQVNGSVIFLAPQYVHKDAAVNTLTGSMNTDPMTKARVHNWFFFDFVDIVNNFLNGWDRKMNET
jgi:hypothetical protein